MGSLFLVIALLHLSVSFNIHDCVRSNLENLVHTVSEEILLNHCERISTSISSFPWMDQLLSQEGLLLNDVAPFTVLTEPPFVDETKRSLLIAYLDHIASTSNCEDIPCITLALNERIWAVRDPPISFEAAKANGLNSYGVEETWERGNGSCTSMSVFLVTGLRLLGVPSRLAGVPHWNLGPSQCPNGDASDACGNHNWVEVYVPDLGWSFVDQRRPDQQILPLNNSWFYPGWTAGLDRQGNHSAFAVSFRNPDKLGAEYPKGQGVDKADHFPMVWDWSDRRMHAWDVTSTYIRRSFTGIGSNLVIESE